MLFITELILSGFWYTGSAVTAIFLLVAGVAGCQVIFARQSCQVYTLSKLMLLYLLWLFIVAWLSAVPETAMMNLAILAGLPVMYLFATNTSTFAHIWQYLRAALFVVGIVLAFWAFWQVFYHIGYGYAQGPFQDRNLFAALMNLLWFPAAFVFLTANNSRFYLKQLAISIILFIISAGLFATTSRGGIATWLLLAPVLLWAANRSNQSRKRIVLIVLITALAYLCSASLLNATIADRTFQLSQDPSTTARLLLWKSSLEMLLAHPVVGSGWGTFIHYYPAYRVPQENTTVGMLVHNDYLQLALEGGIPALLLQIGIVSGILVQLKRILKRATDVVAFESVTLLLGVLALFIHALVNFIFYQALMNILAGLYLARAAQLTDKTDVLPVFNANKTSAFFKYLFASAVVVLIALPYGVHLLGLSINNKHNVKVENLVSDKFSVYKLAEFITAIQPQDRVSQETILQTAELALEDEAFISKMDKDFYRRLLDSTLQRFNLVRALNANDAGLGIRQAKILIRHHEVFDGDYAYKRAHQVLNENLSANPYHVDSIIALSHLQLIEGHADAALRTMQHARANVLILRDKQLVHIELLRQLAAPKVIPELNAIEKELGKLRLGSETGKALILPENYYVDIDAKLDAIAYKIQHKTL
ncbi:MAG TPA: O-antigen ligase family protein [Methylotenera sp.]